MSEPGERIRVAVIGAGQAGLALSRALDERSIDHVVFERDRVASAWRRRWDSFTLVTPNALMALPGAPIPRHAPERSGAETVEGSLDADGFLTRDDVVRWLDDYAKPVRARLRTADVTRVTRTSGDNAFAIETSAGRFVAERVVVCIGLGKPTLPACAQAISPSVAQVHTDAYRAPSSLPAGGVLVVGSGQSGVQIAAELAASGRKTTIACGACGWVPRRYLDKDILVWAEEIGFYDRLFAELRNPRLSRASCQPQLIGKHGGTLNLAVLHALGVKLVGRVEGARGDELVIGDNLEKSLRFGDEFAKNFMNSIDVYARGRGIPTTTAGYASLPWQGHVRSGQDVRALSLSQEGIASIVWATGYAPDFAFIDGIATDEDGFPLHEAGVSSLPGLFFVGLPYQTKRSSGLLHGVGDDAAHIAGLIAATGAAR